MLIKAGNKIVNTNAIVLAEFFENEQGKKLHLYCNGRYANGQPLIVTFEDELAESIWNKLSDSGEDVEFVGVPPVGY